MSNNQSLLFRTNLTDLGGEAESLRTELAFELLEESGVFRVVAGGEVGRQVTRRLKPQRTQVALRGKCDPKYVGI